MLHICRRGDVADRRIERIVFVPIPTAAKRIEYSFAFLRAEMQDIVLVQLCSTLAREKSSELGY